MNTCEIEVCAYSLESCINAQKAEADRVELCSAMWEGGLSPSLAMIEMARQLTPDIELYIMVRPRGGDFLYSDLEYQLMKKEIEYIKNTGVDGIVLGILTAQGEIDVERVRELVKLAYPLKVTFHRAFDMVKDYKKALEQVIETGCYRILTSGLKNTAIEGMETIKDLVNQSAGRIKIMAGSGVNEENVKKIAEIGVDAVHLSGKKRKESGMIYRNPEIFMGGCEGISEYNLYYSDVQVLKNIRHKLEK